MGIREDALREVASKLGITLSTNDQFDNFETALNVAHKEKLDPDIFLKLLNHENSFNNQGGNGGGVGQFIDSTAQGYGFTQEYLRSHPKEAVQAVAKLFKDNASALGGDQKKAAAAYFVGADIIDAASKMPGDWLQNADTVFKQRYPEEYAKQGGPSSYVHNLGIGYAPSKFGSGASTTATKPSVPVPGNSSLSPPNIADFQTDDGNGGKVTDTAGYYKAWSEYQAIQESKQKLDSDPLAQYVDDTIKDIQSQIESRKLDLNKANDLLSTKVNTFKNANDVYSSDVFRYGAAPGATSVPGAHPGQTIPISGGVQLNPLQQALDINNQAGSLIGNIQTPQVPSLASIMSGYQGQYGGQVPGQQSPSVVGAANVPPNFLSALQGVNGQGFGGTPSQPPPAPPPPQDNQVTNGPTSNANAGTGPSDVAALARILAQQAEGLGAPS